MQGSDVALVELRSLFDAVLLAIGAAGKTQIIPLCMRACMHACNQARVYGALLVVLRLVLHAFGVSRDRAGVCVLLHRLFQLN